MHDVAGHAGPPTPVGETPPGPPCAEHPGSEPGLTVIDLGRCAYLPAHEKQLEIHRQVVEGEVPGGLPGAVILVEHDPVITVSRRAQGSNHLLAAPAQLAKLGIEVQTTDRGGDITYHGPGQLVAYPILRLADMKLNVGGYLRWLEEVVIQTVAAYGVTGTRNRINTGVWVESGAATSMPLPPAKLCAIGVRVKKNVTLHGLALNVTTNLSHFATIVPCGLTGVGVTSLQQCLGARCPTMDHVKATMVATMNRLYAQARQANQ